MKRRELLFMAFENGERDIDALADEFGYSVNTVIRYLRVGGYKRGRPSRYKKKGRAELCDKTRKILADLESGIGAKEVAAKYGITRQAVYLHRKRIMEGENG